MAAGAAENGWFLTDQFCHPGQRLCYEETPTGRPGLQPAAEWECSNGVAGTGGTINLLAAISSLSLQVRIVLADPIGSRLAHLVDNAIPTWTLGYLVEGIGGKCGAGGAGSVGDRRGRADQRRGAGTAGCAQEGLLVGGSSGTVVAAALRVAARADVSGPVVALLGDGWDRYRAQPWMQRLSQQTE